MTNEVDVNPFENDTFLQWDDLKDGFPGRAIRVVGVKCVDLPEAAWELWKTSCNEGVSIEVAIERFKGLGLEVEVVGFD